LSNSQVFPQLRPVWTLIFQTLQALLRNSTSFSQ
jgi:hypothetical protein